MAWWTVPPEWPGATVFIVCGGPSLLDSGQLDKRGEVFRLKNRKVIAVNSSYERAPWADYLFFGDTRWWAENHSKLWDFKGRMVTVAKLDDRRLLRLKKRKPPPGISDDRGEAVMRRTSTQGAMNLAAHLIRGDGRIVLVALDLQAAPDGRQHHHTPHKWTSKPGCWDEQLEELRMAAPRLAERNIEVLVASSVSRIDFWPTVKLEDVL